MLENRRLCRARGLPDSRDVAEIAAAGIPRSGPLSRVPSRLPLLPCFLGVLTQLQLRRIVVRWERRLGRAASVELHAALNK